jgi:hypothetical protein
MAKAIEGSLLSALRGQIGKQLVVRRTRHGAVVSAFPARSGAERTAAQKAHQERFRRAALYAKGAQARPEYIAAAKKRGSTPFNVATGDFLHPPEIKRIQLAKYRGTAGDVIEVVALDDVLVTAVTVTLATGGGELIEQGPATRSGTHQALWVYTATQDAPAGPVKVTVQASDLAGNVTSAEAER